MYAIGRGKVFIRQQYNWETDWNTILARCSWIAGKGLKHTTELCGELRFSYIRVNWRQCLENGQVRRIKEAKFPLKKYFCDFKRDKYDAVFASKFEELETLAFIPNKGNIILLGMFGAGKTYLAIALGIAACMKGHNVLFAYVSNLIIEKETVNNNRLSNFDELRCVSMDKKGCEMLFNLISSRHDKDPIIAKSTLTFDRWEEVLNDPTLTGALIDLLAHKTHVLDISRDKGGRFEEIITWLEGSKR